jgi:hypothetical protein
LLLTSGYFETIRHKLNTSRVIRFVMGYQPHAKSPRRPNHEYKKPLREKGKDRKRIQRRVAKQRLEEKPTATEKEISEGTLKRLHTLGNQKFGSSPFSQHYDRWLTDVTIILSEFESYPNIIVDDQYVRESSQTLSIIKQQLEDRRLKEDSLEREIRNLSDSTKSLEQINTEYVTTTRAIKTLKNREVKKLCRMVETLEKEQKKVIQMKTGFFRGISRKDREQKEIETEQQLDTKQRELELVELDFNARQKKLREEYERKREPVLEKIKKSKKLFQYLETDGSLEERWFACEALVDSVITFMERKSNQPKGKSN